MHLKTIKLAGFKSFVDPTQIHLQSNLTAIVGPNGCGKSNIIDAVRWVIGESSAKHLRGESLTDVIFNGSSKRQPVRKAAIELIFDNSQGRLGGAYAQYNEISIRREINREAISTYYLNNARCRRRDIMDVFLGTGLGPRSYSIIEQGMISRIIEAKPEDLRVYLEEVAGISKYKERRRETETRIRHTRENLERLTDLREELEKQLTHLKRQANAALRYKDLKQEQRLLKVQLHALHCQALKQELQQQDEQIKEQEVQLEAKLTEQQNLNTQLEKLRETRTDTNDAFNAVQERYYRLGAEIARMEQHIKSSQERKQQLEEDLLRIEQSAKDTQQHLDDDRAQSEELEQQLEELEPNLAEAKYQAEQSREQLQLAEESGHEWQHQWDELNRNIAESTQKAQVEQTQIQHLEQRILTMQQRIERIEQENSKLDDQVLQEEIQSLSARLNEVQTIWDAQQQEIQELTEKINLARTTNQQLQQDFEQQQTFLRELETKQNTLEALQKIALGKQNSDALQWLTQQQLDSNPRLAECLQVEKGWEHAAEIVLKSFLEAVCVEDFTQFTAELTQFSQGQLTIINSQGANSNITSKNFPTLAAKVTSKWPVQDLLNAVYIAENMDEALTIRGQLSAHESVITRQGVWLGQAWLSLVKTSDEKSGILEREQELQQLNQEIGEAQQQVSQQEQKLSQAKLDLLSLEDHREQQQQRAREFSTQLSELKTQVGVKQERLQQIQQQTNRYNQELSENKHLLAEMDERIANAQRAKQAAIEEMAEYHDRRTVLAEQREQAQNSITELRQQSRAAQQQADELQIRLESTRTQAHYLQQNIARAEKQCAELLERQTQLTEALQTHEDPLQELQQKLAESLEQHLVIEAELATARQALETVETQLREIENNRNTIEENIRHYRDQLEQRRMSSQALEIRYSGHVEQIVAAEYQLEDLINNLPEVANTEVWEEKINQIENQIQRLGPINLAAIDEHAQLTERKEYMDTQNEDLLEALTTLENAIQKIDKETRARFKETFDKTNENFSHLFPKVFGGGQASLELTEDNLLDTGVVVKAQPPGKRNASIHLLSGGEKALTAVALVFALFQLNPAPFCILDEVDAPLDDLNVGRYCQLLQEMADSVQFIFISHNKIAIAIAKQLAGVTMHEPGVSRMVAVDIDEAIAMAEA